MAVDNKTGEVYESKLDEEITLLEDSAKGVSGPLFVKGGIQVESEDGQTYEVRNRQTLCAAVNPPTNHFVTELTPAAKFNDGFLKK